MFRVDVADRQITVVLMRDGSRVTVTGDEAQLTIEHEGETAHCSRVEIRRTAAYVLGFLDPALRPLLEPVLAVGLFIPDPPATFPYVRLFRQLRAALETWRQRCEPEVVAAQSHILDVFGVLDEKLRDRSFYADPHVTSDIARYRAAVLAIPLALESDNAIVAMQNWRGLFSPDGKPYRSLNRTLMNLVGPVDWHALAKLRLVRLERPLTDPLELAMAIEVATVFDELGILETKPSVVRRVLHSPRFAIEAGFGATYICGRGVPAPGDRDALARMARILAHTPEGKTQFPRMVEQGIEAYEKKSFEDRIASLGGWDAPTARPRIELPKDPGVRFISTLRELHDEGETMMHCAGQYLEEALNGRLYFFHVDAMDSEATIAINTSGEIEEINGPENEANAACAWAVEFFGDWIGEATLVVEENPAQLHLPGLGEE